MLAFAPAAAPTRVAPTTAAPTPAADGGGIFGFSLADLPGIDAAEIARRVPGYTLFTVIIGYNPLTSSPVDRNALTLLQGLMELVPFGAEIFDTLSEHGIIQAAFSWVESELGRLNLTLARIRSTLAAAWVDIRLAGGVEYNLGVLRRHFGGLLNDVVSFARSLVGQLIAMIRAAALGVAEELLAENRAWALTTKVLRQNPLTGETVEASTVEILEDFLMLIGKEQELAQMRERGTLQRTADWLDTQIATFGSLLTELSSLFSAAWEAIQPENLPNLMGNLEALVVRAGAFLQRVWDFALTVAVTVLKYIKDALLAWLSSFANEVPGFNLLTVILGRNPFTGEEVPPSAENLIRGFITLLPGGEQSYAQLAETGTIAQAAQRIEGAMETLGISWEMVTGLFRGLWDSLSIDDLIDPISAFQRVVDRFGEPIARLFSFIQVVVREVFSLILQLMNFPSDILGRIIDNAMQAYEDIKRDPVAFFEHMLEAVKEGFSKFFDNILQHLLTGVTEWLFGQLRDAGVEPPADLSLESILGFVLDVLGITAEHLWEKLGEHIGPENVARIRGALDRLTGMLAFVRDVQERGIVAVWEYIQGQLSNLWGMVLAQARDWIVTRVIERVVAKLLSMLDPTGIMAVVNSFMALFNAIQSVIRYFRAMLEIIDRYVSTIASVARGDVEPGAVMLEQGLASSIPVAIGFLANQVGLGNLADKIAEVIGGVRELVDQALAWLIERAVALARSILRSLGLGGEEEEEEEGEYDGQIGKVVTFTAAGESHKLYVVQQDGGAVVMVESTPKTVPELLDEFAGMAAELQDQTKQTKVTGLITQAHQLHSNLDSKADTLTDQASKTDADPATIAQTDNAVESAEDKLAAMLQQIREELGISCFSPGKSAEGIGNTARHGKQGSSLREGERLWWLESEHVLPFATGRYLWQALALYLPERGWSEDTQQTTVMIYYGAARDKTPRDNAVSRLFQNALNGIDIAGMFESERDRYENGDENALSNAREILEQVLRPLTQARADAVNRTTQAIKQEHETTEKGCVETNGKRRGEAQPVPSQLAVEAASQQQYEDLLQLVKDEVSSAEDRRRRFDRILGRDRR